MTNGNHSTKALTRRELSDLIQVTCETLSRWHAQGRGPRCVKDGRCVRYHPDEVEAWLRGERGSMHEGHPFTGNRRLG
jgi:predicted DNA-binding transcriptional regulator AlpA